MSQTYAGMKVNVLGLGATGLSLVRFLRARGAAVSVFDSNAQASGKDRLHDEFPEVIFQTIDLRRDRLPPSDLLAISPGVPRATPAVQAVIASGVDVVGDIELFAQSNWGLTKIFAITGSNGKTTTANICWALTKEVDRESCLAGNVGLPVLDAMREHANAKTWVLELSSFQLESTRSLECEAATVLNVTVNHLDRYPSFFAYAASKERIFAHAKRQVVNRDDVWSSAMRRVDRECTSFGADAPSDDNAFGIRFGKRGASIARGGREIADCDELKVRGTHNTMNAMAALALTDSLGIASERVRSALTSFGGVPHRYEWLGHVAGVDVINDSKATTVVAATAAIAGSQAPVWLIAGGDGKGQTFEALAGVAKAKCRAVHVIGKDAAAIGAALDAAGVVNRRFDTIEDATSSALDQAKPGELVLLSPACASWDMFRNFEHRAQVFSDTVNRWAQSKGCSLSKERGHA
jgi:UDP-N-acetylmuramoylalanine--D-glutamate ligase